MVELDHVRPQQATIILARILKRQRTIVGLTQEELAARSGISSRTISDLECGRVRRPQRRTLRAIAGVLALQESAFQHVGIVREESIVDTTGQRHGNGEWLSGLPPEVADVTERSSELGDLLAAVNSRTPCRIATVVTVVGVPGVGKTAFAVHAGHHLAEHYPDGCFFLRMGGKGIKRRSPFLALGTLLRWLGVPERQLPRDVEERSSLYRSLLRGRKMLLILDEVMDEEQVRPLRPDNPDCLVLLTSRRMLAGLESVTRVLLDVLDPAASVRMLASIIGPERVARERRFAVEVADLCGHLPLALRIAGNRLASRPGWSIEDLAFVLRDPQRRLSTLTAGDLDLRAEFNAAYGQCDDVTKAVFRRLFLVGRPEITVRLAAIVAEVDLETAEWELEELVDAGLLSSITSRGRYVLNDLLRLFAGERLAAEEHDRRVQGLMSSGDSTTGTHGLLPPTTGQ